MEYVWVQVPTQILGAVYELLADLHGRPTEGQPRPAAAVTPVPPPGIPPTPSGAPATPTDSWDREEVQRMVNESPRGAVCILRALASVKDDDKWLSIDELGHSLKHKPGADHKAVGGTLGAFGRRVVNRYRKSSPYEARQGANAIWEYRLIPALRQLVLDCLNRAGK
jgi:hypothetical protein